MLPSAFFEGLLAFTSMFADPSNRSEKHIKARSLGNMTSPVPSIHDNTLTRRLAHGAMAKKCIVIQRGGKQSGNTSTSGAHGSSLSSSPLSSSIQQHSTSSYISIGSSTSVLRPSSFAPISVPIPSSVPARTSSTPAPTPTPTPHGRVIQSKDMRCGGPNAVAKATVASGPNGHINWITCGIDRYNPTAGGWNPPFALMKDLIYVPLSDALKDPNSPFHACGPYLAQFSAVAKAKGIPDIVLASFAMQESSCQPGTGGQGGEVGMFQLSPEKCIGVPNCWDPAVNMAIAADYIQNQLRSVGGNVFMMIGNYNGYVAGLTYQMATAAANTICCRCQNNLDYIHQVVNGWWQNAPLTWTGADGKPLNQPTSLGTFHNLDVCNGRQKRELEWPRRQPGLEGAWSF